MQLFFFRVQFRTNANATGKLGQSLINPLAVHSVDHMTILFPQGQMGSNETQPGCAQLQSVTFILTLSFLIVTMQSLSCVHACRCVTDRPVIQTKI